MFIKTDLSGWAVSLVADGVQTCLNWFNFLLTAHTVSSLFSEKPSNSLSFAADMPTPFIITNTVKIKVISKKKRKKEMQLQVGESDFNIF